MQIIKSISKISLAFTLGFAMVVSGFSGITASANSSSSSSNSSNTSSVAAPEALSAIPYLPKINLIQNSFVYNAATNQWQNKAQSQTWQEKACSDLYSQGIKGIADYQDGVSMEKYKTYPDPALAKANYANRQRYCGDFYQKAGNIGWYCISEGEETAVSTYQQSLQPKPVCGMPVNPLKPMDNPVYAYQYTYQYDFPENLKSTYSEGYRKMTGMEGDYDGIMWTYTFYTHREVKPVTTCTTSIPESCSTTYELGAFKPWENPTANTEGKGWLIYGVKKESANGIYTTSIANTPNPGKSYTLTYNKNTKQLRFQGEVIVGYSGCWSLANNHSFIIKPYSDGTYNSFRLLYETRATGFGPCTANVPQENLDYTQDMSSLAPAGEQFLINYITQNNFKAEDVQSYTGMMPIG
jgi:hypothetical protein